MLQPSYLISRHLDREKGEGPIPSFRETSRGWAYSSMGKHMLSICKTLGSNTSAKEEEREGKGVERMGGEGRGGRERGQTPPGRTILSFACISLARI